MTRHVHLIMEQSEEQNLLYGYDLKSTGLTSLLSIFGYEVPQSEIS